MAVAMPSGTAMTTAPTVTSSEPKSSGSRPKLSSIGYQRVPKSWRRGMSRKAGSPSRSRKKKIRAMMTMAEMPASWMMPSMMTSLQRRSADVLPAPRLGGDVAFCVVPSRSCHLRYSWGSGTKPRSATICLAVRARESRPDSRRSSGVGLHRSCTYTGRAQMG